MKKSVYLVLGFFFVALAVAGIVLPLLPTTPFLILAAMFFSKSSDKYHQWLLNNQHFGPLIRNWEKFRCIPPFAKKLSFVMIAIFGTTSIYTIPLISVKILTALLIAYALYFIYNIQNCLPE